MFVMGDDAWDRAATPDERGAMAGVLDEALRRRRPRALDVVVRRGREQATRRRACSPTTTSWDSSSTCSSTGDAFLEFIPDVKTERVARRRRRVARLTGPRGLVSTFNGIFCDNDRPGRILEILDHIGDLQAAGVHLYPQVSPRGVDVRVNWYGGMSFYGMADTWHRVVQGSAEEKRRMLTDPEWRQRARERVGRHRAHHVPPPVPGTGPPGGGAATRPWRLGRPDARRPGRGPRRPPVRRAGRLAARNDLEPGVVGVDVTNADVEGVAAMLRHPAAIISNSDAGAHLQMMCATGDTTLFLTRHVRERGDFGLEDAVWQLTGRQATTLGMADRGVLRPGAVADLTVFALDELHWDKEEFVTDLPRGRRSLPPATWRLPLHGDEGRGDAGARGAHGRPPRARLT